MTALMAEKEKLQTYTEALLAWAQEDLLEAYEMLHLALHWREWSEWHERSGSFAVTLTLPFPAPVMQFYAARDECALMELLTEVPPIPGSLVCAPDTNAHQLLLRALPTATLEHHLLYCYRDHQVPSVHLDIVRIAATEAPDYGFNSDDWHWSAILGQDPQEKPIHCIAREGRAIACASTGQITPFTEEVRAVWTEEAYRRKGLGRMVVSSAVSSILAAGRMPTYVAEEQNLASRGLAESVGFRCLGRFMQLQLPDGIV
jgi:RimJ/RimL family protein N-acetyltransferase